MKQIGTVEILIARVYNLDAECHCTSASTVVVEAGQYPLYRDGMATFWLMHGQLNQRGPWREGDGIFSLHSADVPSEIGVAFPSKRFGPDEWAELLKDSTFTDGHAEQRVRVSFAAVAGGESA